MLVGRKLEDLLVQIGRDDTNLRPVRPLGFVRGLEPGIHGVPMALLERTECDQKRRPDCGGIRRRLAADCHAGENVRQSRELGFLSRLRKILREVSARARWGMVVLVT